MRRDEITIVHAITDDGKRTFEVKVGDETTGIVTLGEMLEQLLSLTSIEPARARYPMQTEDEWADREQRGINRAEQRNGEEVTAFLRVPIPEAQRWIDGLADVALWCRGYMAANPDPANGPISVDILSTVNLSLKSAIRKSEENCR